MSQVNTNSIYDASGGSNAVLYGVAAPANSMGNRNRIINGAMVIDQRNNGAEVNPAVSGAYYLDRWQAASGAASKFKIGQNAGGVTPPAGFTNYLGCTSLSAYTVGAGEAFTVRQTIEGFNTADLAWGTANAQAVTLSFWVYSSLTGTFGGSLRNGSFNRSYPFTFAISLANTWEYKTVTISGDTSGTWATGNTSGIQVSFSLGAGSTFSGAAGSWSGSNFQSATGAVSVVGTNGATFYITGVQLEAGSVASPFERRDYGRELMMAQRYFEKSYSIGTVPATANVYDGMAGGDMPSGQYGRFRAFFRVSKRTPPTINLYAYNGTSGATSSGGGGTNTGAYSNFIGEGSFGIVGVAAGLGTTTEIFCHWTASSEL